MGVPPNHPLQLDFRIFILGTPMYVQNTTQDALLGSSFLQENRASRNLALSSPC